MKKFYFGLLVFAGFLFGCANEEHQQMSVLKIAPRITRVTGLHFDLGDQIGLTVECAGQDYVSNQLMTYDGSFFTTKGFLWYKGSDVSSTLTAYYPYDGKGFPSEFSVAVDQRTGCAPSNLLVAVKTDVRPSSSAIGMTFTSLMSDIRISVVNETPASIEKITVTGTVPTATVDLKAKVAAVKGEVAAAEITACPVTAGTDYEIVVVPQRAAMTFTVYTDDGKNFSKTLAETLLESNKQYMLAMKLEEERLELSLSGEIGNWEPGGELGADENADNGEVVGYEGENYRTAVIGGKVWMAENMRYIPDQSLLQAGVWYPSRSEQACSDADYLREKGLLYDYATATGGMRTLGEGPVRGICPPGWHIPDDDEFNALVSASVPSDFIFSVGYWDNANGVYRAENNGWLLGIEKESNANYHALLFMNGAIKKISSFPQDAACSLRCVKDA